MRRFRNGISANAIYTYSKAIDNAVQAQNCLDTSAERALSSSSRAQRAQPQLAVQHRRRPRAAARWSTAGRAPCSRTGPSPTPSAWAAAAADADRRRRALHHHRHRHHRQPARQRHRTSGRRCARPDSRSTSRPSRCPLAGQWGNAGRNTITGPTQFSLNAVARPHLPRRRAPATSICASTRPNALNHVTFRSFNTTIGSNNLGLLSGPSAMRSMTATLRFRF